jgi:hypothetical protein
MAKRHHHMEHEARHDKKYNEGGYEGHQNRRHQEMKDSGMIQENHEAIANLPQEVMIKAWPYSGSYLPEGLDDTIKGINRQEAMDDGKRDRFNVPKKV